jgi:hypothetical protein
MLYVAGKLCAHVVMTVMSPAAAAGRHISGCTDLITRHQLRDALATKKGKRQARAALCDSQWTSFSSLLWQDCAIVPPSERGGVVDSLVRQGAAAKPEADSHGTPPPAKLRLLVVLLRSDIQGLLVALQSATILASADGAAAMPVVADTPAEAARSLTTAAPATGADPSRVAAVHDSPSSASQQLSVGTGRFRAGRYKPPAMASTGRVPAPPSEAPARAAPAVAPSLSGSTSSAASAPHVHDAVAAAHAPDTDGVVRRGSGAALPSKEEGAVRVPSAPTSGESGGAPAVERPVAGAALLTAPPTGQGVVMPRPPAGPPPSYARVPSGDRRKGWLPNIFRSRSGATQQGERSGLPTARGLGVAVPLGSGGSTPVEAVAPSSRLSWMVQPFGRRGRSLGPVRPTGGDALLPPVPGSTLAGAVCGLPPPRPTGAWPWRRTSASAAPVPGREAAAPLHTRETVIDAIGTPAKESSSLPRFVPDVDGRHGLPPLSFSGKGDADAEAASRLRPTPPAGGPPLRPLPPAAPQSSGEVANGQTRFETGRRPGWFGRFSRGRTLVRATAAGAGAPESDAEAERSLDKPVPPSAAAAPPIHTKAAPAHTASALAAPEALLLCPHHSQQTGGMCGTCLRASTAQCATFQGLPEAWGAFLMAASGCSTFPTAAGCADSTGAGRTGATITDSPRHLLSCLQKIATDTSTLSPPVTDIHDRHPALVVLIDIATGVIVLDTGSEVLIALFDSAPETPRVGLGFCAVTDGSPTSPGSSHAAALRRVAAATGHTLRLRRPRPPASIADTPIPT